MKKVETIVKVNVRTKEEQAKSIASTTSRLRKKLQEAHKKAGGKYNFKLNK